MHHMQQLQARERAHRRRRLLYFGAGVLVPVAIVVAVLIATSGGGKDSGHAKANASARLPKLSGSFAYSSIGVSGRLPKGWKATQTRGTLVRLSSADRTTVVGIGADRATSARAVLDAALAATRRTSRPQTVKRLARAKLAGLPAQSVLLLGRNQRGVPIRVILASARGRKLTYLLEVFTAQRSRVQRLVEAQEILNGLRLTG